MDGVIGGHGPVNAPHRTAQQVHWHPPSAQSISLQMAIMELSKLSKQQDIEFMLCGHLVAMLAFLRLYVSDEHMGWHAALQIAETVAGKGVGLAHSIQAWKWRFLEDNKQLPVSLYGMHKLSILEDKDLAQELHLHLQSLNMKYLHALDIMDYMGQ